MTATPGGVFHRAPLVGEHTDEVLAGLGLSSAEIAELKSHRVVAGGRNEDAAERAGA